MIKALNILFYSCFFLSSFVWQGITSFELKLTYLVLILYIIFARILGKQIILNLETILFLLISTFISMIMVWLGNTKLFGVLSTAAGIGIFCMATFTFFSMNKNKILSVAKTYIWIAVLLAGLSLIQQVFYVLKFELGYNFAYFLPNWRLGFEGSLIRVSSLFPEPAHFAYFLSPALFLSVRRLFFKEKLFLNIGQSLTILTANLLTFSSVAYFSLTFCILFSLNYKNFLQKPIKVFVAILFIFAFITLSLTNSENVSNRFESIVNLFSGNNDPLQNPSVFAFYSNFLVAKESFLSNPIFGSGLNSSYTNYLKYLSTYFNIDSVQQAGLFGLTARDTGSLFLRIPSELGLFGIGFFLFFIWKFRVKKNSDIKVYTLSKMCLVFFIVYAIRIGHYFLFELWFFIAMYFYLHKKQKEISRLSNNL